VLHLLFVFFFRAAFFLFFEQARLLGFTKKTENSIPVGLDRKARYRNSGNETLQYHAARTGIEVSKGLMRENYQHGGNNDLVH
jgi:hypothetical protein